MEYRDTRHDEYVLRVWGNGTAIGVLDTESKTDMFLQGDESVMFLDSWHKVKDTHSFYKYLYYGGFLDIMADNDARAEDWPEYLED